MTKKTIALVALCLMMFAAGGLGGYWIRRDGRSAPDAQVPRTSDGRPDLSGVWQTLSRANWDLLAHAARPGPIVAMGALGATPGGLGVVEGNEIPYQPWAAAKQKENLRNWLQLDPTVKCYLPGVPRATYMPFPFEIVQSASHVMIAYEFASASRTVYLNSDARVEAGVDTWMGWSRGRWDGDTLVVTVNSFNDQTWFDSAGNFHSEALQVTERFTPIDADHLNYEATIEDPKVFTKPWKIRMPLYRVTDQHAQLIEFKCVEFVEELLYGKYRKPTTE